MERREQRRIHSLKICLTCAALQLAVPQFVQAQSVFFEQYGGAVMQREITQTGSADHKIHWLYGDDTALFIGNFSSLIFQQSGNAASALALEVSVADSSNLFFNIASGGELSAEVLAGQYLSTITTTDEDEKNLQIFVSAPDSVVSQDITLSGGPINLSVEQTNSASLRLDYTSLGGTPATVRVLQSGFDTVADLTGSGDSGSLIRLFMRGDTTSAYLDTSLGVNSKLTYNLNRDGASVGTAAAPISVTVPDNQTVIVTFN